MIVFPHNWRKVGQQIQLQEIEETIIKILKDINCNCLALSGGIDSSLLLHYMTKIFNNVDVFTIGINNNHPDVIYAKSIAERYNNVKHYITIPTKKEINSSVLINDFEGDNAVRLLYKYAYNFTDSIIAGDGVDEFMCGYYAHQKNITEDMYYEFLSKLQKEQLIPLHKNSGKIKIYLPYIDDKLIFLLSQIQLKDKVDSNLRKKIMIKLSKDKISDEIINRWKYGFCHALTFKKDKGTK